MIVKNYPQFAKKTLFIGVDRSYFILLLFSYGILAVFFSPLVGLIFLLFSYVLGMYLFMKNLYWFDKLLIKFMFRMLYKFTFKYKSIIGR